MAGWIIFALGGNSLLAMQLVRQLNRELKLNMKLTDLYQYSTLRDIARNFSPAPEEVREEELFNECNTFVISIARVSYFTLEQ